MTPLASEAPQALDAPPEKCVPRRNAIVEWVIPLVFILFCIVLLVQSFVIPTVSMEDTLLRGDHLLVDKLVYAPEGVVSRYLLPYAKVRRGDIVVFRLPVNLQETYVKRVIGVPGDRIRLVNKQLWLNGKETVEPYALHKTSYSDSYRDNFPGDPNVRLPERALAMLEHDVQNGELVVPPGAYFVMGDNRDNSLDSRYWGFVPAANVIGKPLLIWWSYDAPSERLADRSLINVEHILDLGKNLFRNTRWNRTCHLIHGYPLQ